MHIQRKKSEFVLKGNSDFSLFYHKYKKYTMHTVAQFLFFQLFFKNLLTNEFRLCIIFLERI